MMHEKPLVGRKIVLAVTGGIAAYKTPELARLLKKKGADVRVILSESAKAFVSVLVLQTVTENPVHETLFSLEQELSMGHIELANWADTLIIAPITANTLAKLSIGLADDLLTTFHLVFKGHCYIAPAMNTNMWFSQTNQEHVSNLREKGAVVIGPEKGLLACGLDDVGRMSEPSNIVSELIDALSQHKKFAGQRVMITAGPTYEAIDPVRFLGNRSSGKMGYALAHAFKEQGAIVTLITGPSHQCPPSGIKVIAVQSAKEMYDAVFTDLAGHDIFIGAAAVSDYRVQEMFHEKLEKQNELTLTLIKNPDIIASVSASDLRPKLVIGFAAQTHKALTKAREKLYKKKLDAIICNEISGQNPGFDVDTNAVTFLGMDKEIPFLAEKKERLAKKLVNEIYACKVYKEENRKRIEYEASHTT